MKCPNCGAEIPDDYMYCGKCGTEIHIVPEFDPEVENKINETLFDLAKDMWKSEEKEIKSSLSHKKSLFNHKNGAFIFTIATFGFFGMLLIAVVVVFFNGGFDADSDVAANSSISVEYVEDDVISNLITSPVFSYSGGEYEEAIEISITSGENADIYYTVNGDPADNSSILYESPIILADDGEYIISAIAIDENGNKSEVVSETYTIEIACPSAPVVVEQSGEYSQNTMIVVVPIENCTIYYTTDGTEPTSSSKIYTSPISMPIGTSHYAFVAVDQENNYSEITYRDYHLIYTRLVSTDQAISNVINVMVKLKNLINSDGEVIGLGGYHYYEYDSTIEIDGSGEYYVIVEKHMNNDGSNYSTGLLYAVNTNDGTVSRLGYDSSGKYTLITLSNR
ncbi:MAG: chitobiase/beta-hexosaminidase C-terminal domain-containing protein [Butyrivibrio sp.]|nr:chitobiase/beta-hexosaminidase C-terminal domain-containing protein [Butyrivibrio sp.]